MCEFVSWIEKDGKCIFLTGDDVFRSKRGKELQAHDGTDDLDGHGAIRWFYNFKGGTARECTDFSTPDNFPPEIVDAIKSGTMRGLGFAEGLLTPKAWAEYEKIRQPALAEYKKIEQPAWAEYEKIERPVWAEYKKIEQQALAEYKKIRQPALAEYEKIRQPALAEYKKIKQQAFWNLFSKPGNRNKKWR